MSAQQDVVPHGANGTTHPWSEREERLLGTMTDRAVAERIGRTRKAVETRRLERGIAPVRARARRWTKREERLLGRMTDGAVARRLGVARRTAWMRRRKLGIARWRARAGAEAGKDSGGTGTRRDSRSSKA